MDILLVTGLSGAGKSHAVDCLEDIGYYCIDNIPPRLMMEFVKISGEHPEKVAFVIDIRGGMFFDDLKECLDELGKADQPFKIMFIEASDAVLLRRYKETRRSHPLDKDGDIRKAIKEEKTRLQFVRDRANFIIDTTNYKVADLNEEIKRLVLAGKEGEVTYTVSSFGFKFGVLQEADWIMDVRFIPNPFYVSSLKNLTGKNKRVRDYVMKKEESQIFLNNMINMMTELAPNYAKQGKYHLHIAFGCTGGRHRSVVMAEEFAAALRKQGHAVNVIHRELENRK